MRTTCALFLLLAGCSVPTEPEPESPATLSAEESTAVEMKLTVKLKPEETMRRTGDGKDIQGAGTNRQAP